MLVYICHALRLNLTVLKNSWLTSYIKGKLKMKGRETEQLNRLKLVFLKCAGDLKRNMPLSKTLTTHEMYFSISVFCLLVILVMSDIPEIYLSIPDKHP